MENKQTPAPEQAPEIKEGLDVYKRQVYLLRCADATLYCGVTTDMERRLREHNAGRRGAKYTRARRPVELVCCVAQPDASSACRLEWEVKQRPRAEKAAFLLAREMCIRDSDGGIRV